MLTSKLFVLDTNVILHDCRCIRKFEENDVAIPITVLEELDQFKRGNEDIHFQAREFLRCLDALTGDVLSPQGSPLGDWERSGWSSAPAPASASTIRFSRTPPTTAFCGRHSPSSGTSRAGR